VLPNGTKIVESSMPFCVETGKRNGSELLADLVCVFLVGRGASVIHTAILQGKLKTGEG